VGGRLLDAVGRLVVFDRPLHRLAARLRVAARALEQELVFRAVRVASGVDVAGFQ